MRQKLCLLLVKLLTITNLFSQQTDPKTLAHWKFDPTYKKSGTIKDGNLILKDLSGNKNDLEFKVLKINKTKDKRNWHGVEVAPNDLTASQKEKLATAFEWKTDSYGNSTAKNLLFKKGGRKEFWNLSGYFQTAKTAPLNTKNFKKGYTIEVIFKMPKNFVEAKHKWIALFNRHGSARQLAQKSKKNYAGGDAGSTIANLNISSLRELQWTYYGTRPQPNGTHFDNQTSWSFTLDDSDWYRVVLVNDTKRTKIFINGVTDFRNADPKVYEPDAGIALTIDSKFGWDIGAKGDTFDDEDKDGIGEYKIKKIFEGQIQEIRFTDGALPKDKWLYGNITQNSFTKIGTNKDIPLLNNKENYNLVLVPDTQKPIRYMPEIVDEQMKWLVNNSKKENIVFTTFLGDLVDRFSKKHEWENIDKAIRLLDDAKIPYLTTDGNHDGVGLPPTFNKYKMYTYLDLFGKKRYKGKSYYHNESPSEYSPISFFRGKDYTYLVLAVPFYDSPYIKDLGGREYYTKGKEGFYDKLFKKYSYLPTIIITHQHMKIKEDGTGIERAKRVNGKGAFARNQWEQIISKNNQVFMVFNGHHHGAGYKISKNNDGNDVLEAVFDYQSGYHGGNGWMNFAEFNEANNKVHFKVFSPWVDKIPENKREYYDVKHLTRPGEMFTYNVNFNQRFKFYPKLSFNKLASKTLQNQININYNLSKEIPEAYIGVYKKGEEANSTNLVVKKSISGVKGNVSFQIINKGEYYAALVLKVKDKKGTVKSKILVSNNLYFNIDKSLSTQEIKKSGFKLLYPNPFNDFLTIEASSNIKNVIIFDLMGKKVLEKSALGKNKTMLNTYNLSKGIYIITIQDKEGNSLTQRIIKE